MLYLTGTYWPCMNYHSFHFKIGAQKTFHVTNNLDRKVICTYNKANMENVSCFEVKLKRNPELALCLYDKTLQTKQFSSSF